MSKIDPIVHLHVHTDYSELDGHSTLGELADEVARLGQPAVAITDHGTIGGAMKFWKECTRVGVKPIIGCEFYVAPSSRLHKEPVFWGRPEQRSDDVSNVGSYTHLTVIALSDEGVRNLFRLHATSYADGFYRKPRIDLDALAEHNSGLLVTTGCAGGAVAVRLRLGQQQEALGHIGSLREIFGDRLYIEIMEHENPIDKIINPSLVEMSRKLHLPMVATNDSHYTTAGDAVAHDALLCVQTRQQINGVRSFKFEGSGYHLRSHREMAEAFREVPDAVSGTLVVAERVEEYREVFTGIPRFPRFTQSTHNTNDEYLWSRIRDFIDSREWTNRDEVERRATYEFETISSLGFTDYHLVVDDIIGMARKAGIRVGPGRGSAGGSFVVWALGITDLNPFQHGLFFERYLNADRVSWPDIDFDIQDDRRDEFLNMVADKYGHSLFAQIGTYGTIAAKSAIHDASRVLGRSRRDGDLLTFKLPKMQFGRTPMLSEGDWTDLSDKDQEVIDLAGKLEGRIRSRGVHASGIIISPEPLDSILPLHKTAKYGDTWITTFEMGDVEHLGLVKFDALGLKNLKIIENCLQKIKTDVPVMSTNPADMNDPRTFKLLQSGNTLGVFQLDSEGMQRLLRRLKPDRFEDVSAVIALYRPGPMGAGAHNDYADRKNGKQKITFIHPELATALQPILADTYGVIVYQEQVMEIARKVANYSLGQADILRRAMGKKKREILDAERKPFAAGMRANGYSDSAVSALWDILVPFADYSFNRSHTAGYGTESYWTGWLKANEEAVFMAEVLSAETDPKKLPEYIEEVERMGIRILPPDVNTSDPSWTATSEGIRYGLSSIKGFGDKAFGQLLKARPFVSLHDFFVRADKTTLGKKTLGVLIQSGALDELCPHRSDLYLHSDALSQRALNDRKLYGKGARPLLGSRYDVIPSGAIDNQLKQTWERELLGTVLTLPPVSLKATRWLRENEFFYIRELVQKNPGRQQLTLGLGYATIDVGYLNWSDKVKNQLLSIGGIEVEQAQ